MSTATVDGIVAFDDVMSCTGRVIVHGDHDRVPELAARAVDRLRELEARWSRFLPDSEVTRLNAAHGSPIAVSADTVALVTALVDAWRLTEGSFDPTLLRPLVELGYDTSRTAPHLRTTIAGAIAARGHIDGIVVDPERRLVRLPAGTALDPGGLGKGLAADRVCDELTAAGAIGCLVEIGGDLRVRGEAPGGYAWTIDLAGTDDAPLLLGSGGVATSTTLRRTWRRDGREMHHLLDPTTLQPTAHGVVTCTVAAGSAALAEALTKVAFVRGLPDAVGFFAGRGIAARIVDADETCVTTPGWRALTDPAR